MYRPDPAHYSAILHQVHQINPHLIHNRHQQARFSQHPPHNSLTNNYIYHPTTHARLIDQINLLCKQVGKLKAQVESQSTSSPPHHSSPRSISTDKHRKLPGRALSIQDVRLTAHIPYPTIKMMIHNSHLIPYINHYHLSMVKKQMMSNIMKKVIITNAHRRHQVLLFTPTNVPSLNKKHQVEIQTTIIMPKLTQSLITTLGIAAHGNHRLKRRIPQTMIKHNFKDTTKTITDAIVEEFVRIHRTIITYSVVILSTLPPSMSESLFCQFTTRTRRTTSAVPWKSVGTEYLEDFKALCRHPALTD